MKMLIMGLLVLKMAKGALAMCIMDGVTNNAYTMF